MSWIQALFDTYNQLEKKDGIFLHEKLLKVGYSTQNAHIEVVINKDGEFREANFIEKDHASTTIPVTEGSASRGAGIEPHALCDKLKYIAGDYERYCGENNDKFHEAYIDLLTDWCESAYSDRRITAVLNYLKKDSIISDIIECDMFSIDNTGYLTKKWEKAEGHKLSVGDQSDAFVRFRVTGSGMKSELWEDEALQDKYIAYYLSKEGNEAFCYVTGNQQRGCGNHPSKLRNTGDKAKLISSNDKTNFTFRGRFDKPEQAYSISYEASQKAHNALKWLIQKQGVRVGDKVFVLWGVEGEAVPDILADTLGIIERENSTINTQEKLAQAFKKAILGYRQQIRSESRLVLLGLDAATTGRLAIVFCREYYGQQGNELIDHIERWHKTCCWRIWYKTEADKYISGEGAPAPLSIARAVFGTDQNGLLKGNDKLFAQVVERLLFCICDDRKIPRDIVQAAVNKAKMPQNYSNNSLWLQVLSIACALYKRYLSDYEKEEVTMEVRETKDLDYNCGRLLAVADAIESWALRDKSDDKKSIRSTTAIRYFTKFSQRPCETWALINNKLVAYKEQLGAKGANLYKLLGEISGQIDIEEFRQASNLDGAFCLGFDSQRTLIINEAIDKKKKQDSSN